MVESFTNIDGSPSILRIETTGEAQRIHIPPFVKVLREVTDDPNYSTSVMASLNYRMP
jgi:CYTH domain-containing protein